jgi:GMP synthase-like glutamine amidotransferase
MAKLMHVLIINCDLDKSPITNGASIIKSELRRLKIKKITVKNATKGILPTKSEPNKYDGIIITGSVAAAYDDYNWIKKLSKLIKEIDKSKIKTLGICFGAQIVAQSLGGSIIKGGGFEEGFRHITINTNGRKSALFKNLPNKLMVYQMHGDLIKRLPNGSVILSKSEKCTEVYMLRNFYCVQFHPEILPNIAMIMCRRDKKNKKKIINNVSMDYKLTSKIFQNFIDDL